MLLELCLCGVGLGSVGFGYDAALINGLLANRDWFVHFDLHPGSAMLGAVIASKTFGGVASIAVAAWATDRFGRRWSIMSACFVNIAASLGQAFVQTSGQFVLTGVLAGFGAGITYTAAAALIAELTPPQHRARAVSLYSAIFGVGTILSAWCAFFALGLGPIWSWRLPVLLQIVLPLGQAGFTFACPESPRWLLLKGRLEEAEAILAKHHGATSGRERNSLANDTTKQAERGEGSVTGGSGSPMAGWSSLWQRPHRGRSAILVFVAIAGQWTGAGVVMSYLPPVLSTVGITSAYHQDLVNFGLQAFTFIMSLVGSFLSQRLPRTRLLMSSAIGMLLCLSVLTACLAKPQLTVSFIVLIFLFNAASAIGFMPIALLYITEILPTSLRAKALSLYFTLSGVGICANQFLNPIALSHLGWKYLLVNLAVLLSAVIVFLFFAPDTNNGHLDDSRDDLGPGNQPGAVSCS